MCISDWSSDVCSSDLCFEIDPSAYSYVEVFKGANALRYGSNALGGAINLVTPTGEDAARLAGRIDVGSSGYVKGQARGGGVSGPLDYFLTAPAQSLDAYRDQSGGNAVIGNLHIGYRLAPNQQTLFFVYASATTHSL